VGPRAPGAYLDDIRAPCTSQRHAHSCELRNTAPAQRPAATEHRVRDHDIRVVSNETTTSRSDLGSYGSWAHGHHSAQLPGVSISPRLLSSQRRTHNSKLGPPAAQRRHYVRTYCRRSIAHNESTTAHDVARTTAARQTRGRWICGREQRSTPRGRHATYQPRTDDEEGRRSAAGGKVSECGTTGSTVQKLLTDVGLQSTCVRHAGECAEGLWDGAMNDDAIAMSEQPPIWSTCQRERACVLCAVCIRVGRAPVGCLAHERRREQLGIRKFAHLHLATRTTTGGRTDGMKARTVSTFIRTFMILTYPVAQGHGASRRRNWLAGAASGAQQYHGCRDEQQIRPSALSNENDDKRRKDPSRRRRMG
jgi:hypothetical protein